MDGLATLSQAPSPKAPSPRAGKDSYDYDYDQLGRSWLAAARTLSSLCLQPAPCTYARLHKQRADGNCRPGVLVLWGGVWCWQGLGDLESLLLRSAGLLAYWPTGLILAYCTGT